jgi:hypothetical protein
MIWKIITWGALSLIVGIAIGYWMWGQPTHVGSQPLFSSIKTTGAGKSIVFSVAAGDSVFVTSQLIGHTFNKATDVRTSGYGLQPIIAPPILAGRTTHLCATGDTSSTAGWILTQVGDCTINPYLDITNPCNGTKPTTLHTFTPIINSFYVNYNGKICKLDTYVFDCLNGDKTQITIMLEEP